MGYPNVTIEVAGHALVLPDIRDTQMYRDWRKIQAEKTAAEARRLEALERLYYYLPLGQQIWCKVTQYLTNYSKLVSYYTVGLPSWKNTATPEIIALGGFMSDGLNYPWDNKHNSLRIYGGDGSELIDNLALQLYNDHKALRYEKL